LCQDPCSWEKRVNPISAFPDELKTGILQRQFLRFVDPVKGILFLFFDYF
jgi:hypothetical protein